MSLNSIDIYVSAEPISSSDSLISRHFGVSKSRAEKNGNERGFDDESIKANSHYLFSESNGANRTSSPYQSSSSQSKWRLSTRWLSDLRGKDMPDSFAWSYKRRYKAGYVWQDLVDEDLITPISDNEFVLKGSEISSVPLDACSCGEKKASTEKPDTIEDELQRSPDRKVELTPKISEIELDDKSSEPLDSERSPMTDESMKSNMSRPEKVENKSEKKNKKSTEKKKPPLTSSASSPKSKSYSSGASQVFRNILTCGAVDTNDSALTMINRVQRTSKNNPPETIGGSERIFGSDFNQQPHQQNSRKSSNGMKNSKNTNEKKKVSAPCKPIAAPICSQCGKGFKPEKLHSHMKSCRGMKSLNKSGGSGGGGGASAATIVLEKMSSQRSTESSSKDVSSTYFLTR